MKQRVSASHSGPPWHQHPSDFRTSSRSGKLLLCLLALSLTGCAYYRTVTVQPGQATSILISPDDLMEPMASESPSETPGEETPGEEVAAVSPSDGAPTVLAEDGEGAQVSESRDAETPAEAVVHVVHPRAVFKDHFRNIISK